MIVKPIRPSPSNTVEGHQSLSFLSVQQSLLIWCGRKSRGPRCNCRHGILSTFIGWKYRRLSDRRKAEKSSDWV